MRVYQADNSEKAIQARMEICGNAIKVLSEIADRLTIDELEQAVFSAIVFNSGEITISASEKASHFIRQVWTNLTLLEGILRGTVSLTNNAKKVYVSRLAMMTMEASECRPEEIPSVLGIVYSEEGES